MSLLEEAYGAQLSKLMGTFTTGRTNEDLLSEVGRLHLELRDVSDKLAKAQRTIGWLESQAAVFTPEMCWIRDGEVTLSGKIFETIAMQEWKCQNRRSLKEQSSDIG